MGWWNHLHPGAPHLGVPEPIPCAAPVEGEPVVIKHGFDGFHGTDLHARLQERGVDTLVIIGVITRACVLNTLLSAFNYGSDKLLDLKHTKKVFVSKKGVWQWADCISCH